MNLEQSLRALKEDEAAARVPPQLDAAVMAEWDARARERSAVKRAVLHRHRRVAIGWAIAGAIAASLLTIAVLEWPRAGNATPPMVHGGVTEKAGGAIAPESSPAVADPLASPSRVEEPPAPTRRRRASTPLPLESAGYVLVPDVGSDAPLTMMRVRMSRSAFSRLGVPIANPDGDGMVDVDVLVGEDGVARSIRRAAAVGRDEN